MEEKGAESVRRNWFGLLGMLCNVLKFLFVAFMLLVFSAITLVWLGLIDREIVLLKWTFSVAGNGVLIDWTFFIALFPCVIYKLREIANTIGEEEKAATSVVCSLEFLGFASWLVGQALLMFKHSAVRAGAILLSIAYFLFNLSYGIAYKHLNHNLVDHQTSAAAAKADDAV